MPCELGWPFGPLTLIAGVNAKYTPVTSFFEVADDASVSAWIETLSVGTNGQVWLAVQYAAVRKEKPGTPATIGSAITTATVTPRLTTLSAAQDQMFARLGFITQLSTGTTDAPIELVGRLGLHQCATLIGARRLELPPVLPASGVIGPTVGESWVVELADFQDSAGDPKFKFSLWGRAIQNFGDLRTQAIARTATGPNNPDAWAGIEAGWDTPAAAEDERNTGELTVTLTNKALVQPGFAFARVNGGSRVSGDFSIMCLKIK